MKFETVKQPYFLKEIKEKGLTNKLFILNDKYFIKQTKEETKIFLNWENQLNVINLVKNESFTLPILEAKFFDQKLYTLMPYYQNLKTLAAIKINQNILQQLAKIVIQLHRIKITASNKIMQWKPLEQLNLYCNLIETKNKQLLKIKKELEAWLSTYQPKKIVLTHNDLVINNFVYYQDKWYLIDWDFATLNDYLFDVASFASETLKNNQDINYWYSLFQLSKEELKIVNYWIKYQNLIWYYWAEFLFQKTKNPTYLEIAEEKIKMLFN